MNAQHGTRTVSTMSLSPFISVLALLAVLLGVLALHSESTGHDMHPAGSSMSASVDVSTAAAAGLAAPVVATLSASTHGGLLDCALLAMACVLLLVLVVLVLFRRPPASRRRSLEPPAALLGLATARTAPVPRPSLTLLSIRRV